MRSGRSSAGWAGTVARLGRGIRGVGSIIGEDGGRKRRVHCTRNRISF